MQIPTLIVNNGDVLDVVFTEWGHNKAGDQWYITEHIELPPSAGGASHLVFELPVGCYMVERHELGPLGSDASIYLSPIGTGDRNIDVRQCTIPRKLRQEMVAEATHEINAGTPVEH